jgi:hypothetical protein
MGIRAEGRGLKPAQPESSSAGILPSLNPASACPGICLPGYETVAGLAVLAALIGWRLLTLMGASAYSDNQPALQSIVRTVEWNAAALGMWWGGVTGVLLPAAPGLHRDHRECADAG